MSTSKRKHNQPEAEQQAQLFEWAMMMSGTYPELELMYHIPNGGSRNKLEGFNLKKQGVKSGVPDIHLPVARGKYHSLYIEMKHGDNKPTENQYKWLEALNKQGNGVKICYSAREASEAIIRYLNLPDI